MAKVPALALVLIVIAVGGNAGMAGAQSTPPNSSSSCTASLVSLAPCLTFLQGGPNNSSPTQGCCTALASVVSTNAACLCQLFTTTNNPVGIPINQTRALTLPGACKISTPPVSQCKSPAVSSPPAPTTPSSPTPVVSNPTPTAKTPATSAALPPATTTTGGGAPSPSTGGGASSPSGSHEGSTATSNAGSMTGMSMLINVVGIIGGSLATYILSASSM